MANVMRWLPVIECLIAVLNRCIYRCKNVGAKENVESTYGLQSERSWRRSASGLAKCRSLRTPNQPLTDFFLTCEAVLGGSRRNLTVGVL